MESHIIAVGNVKGGVGKTTIAVNLSIARSLTRREVLLIGGDEQATAQAFTELRAGMRNGTPGYTSVSLLGAAIRTQVRQLRAKYQDIIIDVGGRDTGSLRAALTVADLFLLSVQPRSFDIWALDSVSALVREAREINALNVLAFLNAADSQGHDNEDAAAQIREFPEFEYFDQPLARRRAFPNAAARGLSVLEYTPRDLKAIEEFTCLSERVFRYHSDSVEIPYGNCKEPQTTHKHS